MNDRPWNPMLAVVITVALLQPLSAADADNAQQEAELTREEQTINKANVSNKTAQIEALAKQYGVEPSVVEGLQAKQPGWGGTSIQLSMAQNLVKTDPNTYPTMTEALAKVEALRAEGKGYGAIAKELGFKLGPVITTTRTRITKKPPSRKKRRVQKNPPNRKKWANRKNHLNHDRSDRAGPPSLTDSRRRDVPLARNIPGGDVAGGNGPVPLQR